MENATRRAHVCITAKGGHLQNVISHNSLAAISMKRINIYIDKRNTKLTHFHFI